MQRYKTPALIASVLIAVLIPLAAAYKAHMEQRSYPVVRIAVEPYDPRDLMYGHYMRFFFLWNWKENAVAVNGEACLCVGEGNDNPPVSMMSCRVAYEGGACAHIIKGRYQGMQRFDVGINRYYVDEKVALPLEKLFRDKKEEFSVGLALRPDGAPVLEKLYVSGMPLEEYIRLHRNTLYNIAQ